MTFTKAEYTELSQWETYLARMRDSGNCPKPPRSALERMKTILKAHFPLYPNKDTGCARCIMELLTDVGRHYFADKQEYIDTANDREAVKETKRRRK